MILDLTSFALGLLVAAGFAVTWLAASQRTVRHLRRLTAQRVNLDRVYWEDAERDPVTHAPAVTAPHLIHPDGSAWQRSDR